MSLARGWHRGPSPTRGDEPSPSTAPSMNGVRPLRKSDIPAVAELHRAAFSHDRPLPELEAFLERVLWDNPWRNDDLPSLVLEGAGKRIVGCLGVMARPMIFRDRRIRAAVTNNFMVDPEHRGSLVAIRLMRAIFEGDQDLTLADGNGKSRSLWEASGGSTLHSRGFRWLRILRPTRLGLHLLEKGGVPRSVTAPLGLLGRIPDEVLRWPASSPIHVSESELGTEDLDCRLMRDLLEDRAKEVPLRPVFDPEEIEWLFSTLRMTQRNQTLRRAVVTTGAGEPVGWWVYYARPGGISIVLQLEARPAHRTAVLERLLLDARQRGSAAVSGPVDPEWCDALRDVRCLYDHPDLWTLGRSRDPEIRCALRRGDFFLTRLENESWMRFAS